MWKRDRKRLNSTFHVNKVSYEQLLFFMGDISHFSSLRQELMLGAADRRGNVSLGRGLTLV